MAWLSGLAGKAENLLNKIDQNTAAVLSKEKNEYEHLLQIASDDKTPQHVRYILLCLFNLIKVSKYSIN